MTDTTPCSRYRGLRSASSLALLWLATFALSAVPAVASHPERTAQAVRVYPSAPVIDGVLDDEVWLAAPTSTGFTQRDPDEGKPATEKTTFQIVYDDDALYIGVVCYDGEPDKITSRLARRDDWAERDQISINIDPHHDHRTGFFFAVGPSGWRGDGIIYNDGWDDDSWDGVWQASTSIHERGWSVEYRIPYHVLRFSGKEAAYTWGINVLRDISRKQERARWVMTPSGINGWVSRFGHLDGIEGIEPPRQLEAFPFVLSRSTLNPETDDAPDGRDLFSTIGVDARYGITSNVSLNATVNPDFGQVEADPAVLNLSVFETFFRERRPFFIEGISIFDAPGPDIAGIGGPTRLFHSRRIGKPPGRLSIPDDSEIVDQPDNTTIWGAAKISGKTAGRTSFGILDAVAGSEYATIERTLADSDGQPGSESPYLVEPVTNYFVGRVQQDLRTNSSVGAVLTAVNGDGFSPAYVASADGHFKWRENAYRMFTRFSASRAGQNEDRSSGYEGVFYLSKFSGSFGGQFYADARSPGFQANDLGFMSRNDRIQSGVHVYHEKLHPWALGRRTGLNFNVWSNWNYDGVSLARGVNLNFWNNLKNYWHLRVGVSRDFESSDDLATRGGPVMISPANTWYWAGLGTDDRKAVSFGFDINGHRGKGGRISRTRYSIEPEWRPASNVEIEIEPSYQVQRNFAQWVENVDDDGDGEDDHFVFGELKSQTLEIEVRGTVAFTPDLSLQAFVQPFVAVGNYGQIKELARPNSYEFTPYSGLDDNPDFSRRSLRGNLVLRWEYRPGSTLFLVWQQTRDRDLGSGDPAFRPWQGVGNSLTDDGDNIFLVKFNYWMGM